VVKVAISLPANLLEAIERQRQAAGETRSEFFRRAAGRELRASADARAADRYAEAYDADPETEADSWMTPETLALINEEAPWE
jgi:hypothetical protein